MEDSFVVALEMCPFMDTQTAGSILTLEHFLFPLDRVQVSFFTSDSKQVFGLCSFRQEHIFIYLPA